MTLSGSRSIASAPSPTPIPCSLGVPLPELALDPVETSSLGLLVRVGFVRGELAEKAVIGDGRGCWCMVAVLDPSLDVEAAGPKFDLRRVRGIVYPIVPPPQVIQ